MDGALITKKNALEAVKREAENLLADLKNNPMKVILVPAPDEHHSGHKIRAVESRPPSWYMDKAYKTKGRKTFKRHRFIDALKSVSKHGSCDTEYGKLAASLIQQLIDDPEEFYGDGF